MAATADDITKLLTIVEIGLDNEAYLAADKLAKIGGEEVMQQLFALLTSSNYNTVYLAARALSKIEGNSAVTEQVFELIKNGKELFLKGILVEALEGFDCSQYFVEILKLYLFGNLKVSALAKEILDAEEFDISPRVIRKAEKHYKHYLHNVKKDEDFALKKAETESIFEELKSLFGEEDAGGEEDEAGH